MRLWIFSDLHLEFAPVGPTLEIPNADVCVVAGDILTRGPSKSVRWLQEHVCHQMPVLFVCGNHEFYRSSLVEGLSFGKADAVPVPDLHFLENEEIEIGGVRFWGATLWTDFDLLGHREVAMRHVESVMNDYREVAHSKKPFVRLRASHTSAAHRGSLRSVSNFLDRNRGRSTVVISHHAPSARSIPTRYSTDMASAAFASNLDTLVMDRGPTLWIHGHVHERLDYFVGRTRIVCNPRGYPGDQSFDNFDFQYTIELFPSADR